MRRELCAQKLFFSLDSLLARLAWPRCRAKAERASAWNNTSPSKRPSRDGLLLRQGDRLAICGDSITEQKMYSRLMEDYLTVCEPELNVTVRQYGWGGERAPGFLARMTNDCLRFKPTIATTCYGMNDHEYRTYEDRIGQTYRDELHGHRRGVQGQWRAGSAGLARLRGQGAPLDEAHERHRAGLEPEPLPPPQH